MPALEELRLCGNGIGQLCGSINGFHNLQNLDLSMNAIQHWDTVRPLSELPSLRCLSLNDNQIATIRSSSAGSGNEISPMHSSAHADLVINFCHKGPTIIDVLQKDNFLLVMAWAGFRDLECLLLGNNRIDGWDSVDALAQFINLRELRLSGNPLTLSGKDERFEVKTCLQITSHIHVPPYSR